MTNVHLMYDLANCNLAAATRLYAQRFPNLRLSIDKTLESVDIRSGERRSVEVRVHDREILRNARRSRTRIKRN